MTRPKSVTLAKVSGYLSVLLTALYSTAALFLPPFFGAANVEFLFSPTVLVTYWGGVAALFLVAAIDSFEILERDSSVLMAREFHGVETFHHAKEFLERLADVTIGAENIATLNFSPPQGASVHLDKYFREIHEYLSRSDKLKSFRSIASIEGPAKAQAIVERAEHFKGNARVSFSCFEHGQIIRLMCYHVVEKDGTGYVFLYPPIPLTGVMDGVLIVNSQIAKVMMSQFELTWNRSRQVLVGGIPSKEGVEYLVQQGADTKSASYKALYAAASKIDY